MILRNLFLFLVHEQRDDQSLKKSLTLSFMHKFFLVCFNQIFSVQDNN